MRRYHAHVVHHPLGMRCVGFLKVCSDGSVNNSICYSFVIMTGQVEAEWVSGARKPKPWGNALTMDASEVKELGVVRVEAANALGIREGSNGESRLGRSLRQPACLAY